MIKVANGEKSVVYQSIDFSGRPAVDCFRIVTADEHFGTVLNWGESEAFFQSIREWMQKLPTKNYEWVYIDTDERGVKHNKVRQEPRGICRDADVQEMLKQFLAYNRRFSPPLTNAQLKIEQMQWGE